jgi:hypothetical protein
MFVGVLTCTIPEQNFNRLLVLKQLSSQHVLKQDTCRQQFSINYDNNKQLKVSGANSMMTQHHP